MLQVDLLSKAGSKVSAHSHSCKQIFSKRRRESTSSGAMSARKPCSTAATSNGMRPAACSQDLNPQILQVRPSSKPEAL